MVHKLKISFPSFLSITLFRHPDWPSFYIVVILLWICCWKIQQCSSFKYFVIEGLDKTIRVIEGDVDVGDSLDLLSNPLRSLDLLSHPLRFNFWTNNKLNDFWFSYKGYSTIPQGWKHLEPLIFFLKKWIVLEFSPMII